MRSVKLLSVLASILFVSACSTFSGGSSREADLTEPSVASDMRLAELEVEVTRLKAENARLANRMLEMQRENEKLAASNDGAAAGESAPTQLIAEAKEAPPQPISVGPQPQANAVVEEANAPELAQTDVPVQDAPRLVQPSFASTEAVFENEADGEEIETESVLFGVHLASYRHVAEAREGWRKLQRENPDELGLLEPRLETVNIPDKGVFLRLIGGGFSSREKAAALCANLMQKNMYCTVSGFTGERLPLADGT